MLTSKSSQEWGVAHLIVFHKEVWTPDITVFEQTHQVSHQKSCSH